MFEKIKKHKLLASVWLLALIAIVCFGLYMVGQDKSTETPPQTYTVTKATLTQIVSASGQVASTGQISAITQAAGKVSKVYVQVGSTIKKGDKILEIDPDAATIQNQKTAWVSYLTAKNAYNQAKAKLYTLQAAVIAAQQKFNQDAVDKGLDPSDSIYQQLHTTLLAAQAEQDNQESVISQAKAAADTAYAAYQSTSATVIAPADGTIQDLSYEQGTYVTSSSGASSGGTAVAILKITDKLTAKINVSELDVAGIATDQDVTLTLTALIGKTYHGKVISVASTGATDSNITTFPVVIEISDAAPEIRVGMAVSGDITVQTKENVLAVPNQAITTSGDKHSVTILDKDGKQKIVTVSVGLILDTQSEITAGLSEGDKVVLSTTSDETTADTGSVTQSSNKDN
jgi:macrolide-specific efflux system membrane fusion protein